MSHLTRPPGALNTTFVPSAVARWADDLGKNKSLDSLVSFMRPVAKALTKNDKLRSFLQGNFMGHALHPMLTDMPIGFWTSALTLDVLAPHRGRAASQCLTGLGVLSAAPTAAAGLAEWSDTEGEDARIGVVHAAGNTAALLAFTASYCARRRGRTGWGRALGLIGGLALTASGYLGGHLAIARKVGSHTPVAEDTD